MLSPHLRKFSDLYAAHGLGSVKNIWLITCLIPLARTANLNKMKDYTSRRRRLCMRIKLKI